MSVDIHWETLTSGPDGEQLAETVRAFIDEKFQQVTLPRFIRSVHVHSFDLGTVAPEVDIKDICDPLPDFYDDQEGDGNSFQSDDQQDGVAGEPLLQSAVGISSKVPAPPHPLASSAAGENAGQAQHSSSSHADTKTTDGKQPLNTQDQPTSPLFASLQTPGIPGGTSNMNYFHLPFGPGLSGTATPLAAVAGAHFHTNWSENPNAARSTPPPPQLHHESKSIPSLTPPSTADPSSRPQSRHLSTLTTDDDPLAVEGFPSDPNTTPPRERDPNDIQVVAHVKYSGNLRLSLTAEILLDYPMPSFVGIPLQLNITGLKFDGIAILAYIKRRCHVCFLSPEDAEAFVDQRSESDGHSDDSVSQSSHFGGLLEQIKVESEIGERENGKQVLKNVGKVEKFILGQVRSIFEDEFVYPSFWTFLV